jgi:16S rRNA (guanine527-N7)-methyltransferase
MLNAEQTATHFHQLGIDLSSVQVEQVQTYTRLLLKWNLKMNLTRIVEEKKVYQEHFAESFGLSRFLPHPCTQVLDVGSGAGFPGLVLGILHPGLSLALVESSSKKALFLNEVIRALGMAGNARVIQNRFEQIAPDFEDAFDAITLRGVKLSSGLIGHLCAVLRTGGRLITITSGAQAGRLRGTPSLIRWIRDEETRTGSNRIILIGEKRST